MDFVIVLHISELNLSSGIEELEYLIGSTLSSYITLFEKISSSTYCVRINSFEKKVEESQSDTEDSGAVDDDLGDSVTCSSDDDSGCNSGNSKIKKLTYMNHGKSKDNMVIVYTEIDESHTGEVWLLGLMEGEYSDLSIEEKLSAIVAPIDLLHAGSSFRMERSLHSFLSLFQLHHSLSVFLHNKQRLSSILSVDASCALQPVDASAAKRQPRPAQAGARRELGGLGGR
ncbi:homeobox-DDT domain protein RLT3-like [Prunus yedoensis var. nudiflora]|uniref:Homeobox-DDT domain protein RLT3-like n=1 Tax=Prunus yedoensis var. nudiflora TaxID=2094558 RepID=A0A314Z7R9_PRUYE|nr:homeobox-DDT domain protein RLT3-like [Prunus yedoensis var. nudiflora]